MVGDYLMLLGQTPGVDWIALLQTFGLAVVILIAVGLAAWKAATWTGRELIIPTRDRVISRLVDFLSRIETTVGKLDRNVDRVTENLDKQTIALESIEKSSVFHSEQAKTAAEQASRKEDKIDGLLTGQREAKMELLSEIREIKALVVALGAKVDLSKTMG